MLQVASPQSDAAVALPATSAPAPTRLSAAARQGGCEDEHTRMDYMQEQPFRAAHGEDQ